MQLNQIKIGAFLNYLAIGLNMFIGLIYTPYLLRALGQSEYGLYSLASSMIAYLTVLDLGFGNAIVRYTVKYRIEGKYEEQSKLLGMFFVIYLVIGLIAVMIGGILAINTENIFEANMTASEIAKTKIMLWLMTFNLAFTFPMSIWGSIMSAYERFIFQRIVSILRSILNPLIMLLLLLWGYKAIALVVVTTICNVLTLFVNYVYCKKRLKLGLTFGWIEKPLIIEITTFSFWVFLAALTDKIYWSSGQFILGIVQGAAVVAIYSVAIQLKDMFYLFSTAISSIFLPRITTMVSKGASVEEISRLFIRTGRIQYVILAFILTGFILIGRDFVHLWAGNEYDSAYFIALLFFVSTAIPLIQNLSISILMAYNRLKTRSIIVLSLSILSLFLAVPFSMKYGGIGCASISAITIVITYGFVLNYYYGKYIKIRVMIFWKEIFKMSIIPLIFVVIGLLLRPYIVITSWRGLFLYVIVFSILYIPIYYIYSFNLYEKELVRKPLMRIFQHK